MATGAALFRRLAITLGALVALAIGVVGFLIANNGDVTPTAAMGPPHFNDVTDAAGIDYVYDGPIDLGFGNAMVAAASGASLPSRLSFASSVSPSTNSMTR